jgi:hypothetical protein
MIRMRRIGGGDSTSRQTEFNDMGISVRGVCWKIPQALDALALEQRDLL